MLTPVLYTAQKGKDVFLDDEKFRTIDSVKNQLKVWDYDRITFNLNSANSYSYTKTVTTNFGYRPEVRAWAYRVRTKEDGSKYEIVERFVFLPYVISTANDENNAPLIGSIDRGINSVKFKFFQQVDSVMGVDENYTLEGMQLMYLIYVDPE